MSTTAPTLITRGLMTALAASALVACSQGEEATVPAATEASATAGAPAATGPVTREAVYAAAAEGPEPFVRALYGQYVNGGPTGQPPVAGQDPLFSRTMNALIAADVQAANGEVPTLNYDPVCGCQDQGDFVVTALAVAQAEPNAAEAEVGFTNMGEPRTFTLKLVREGANWKIDDIVDGTASLKDALMEVAERAG